MHAPHWHVEPQDGIDRSRIESRFSFMFSLQILVIALVQGMTEFLPVSSSAHLILVPCATGWADQGQMIDVAAHLGTLLAVIAYFWRDLGRMIGGFVLVLIGRRNPQTIGPARMVWFIFVASLPVVIAGFLVHTFIPNLFRSVEIIAWTTLIFGILLWLADRFSVTLRRAEHMTSFDALLIGCAQVLALLPGTSRSGITMTMGRILAFERPDAARFSMILSIPVILGAGVISGIDLWQAGNISLGLDALLVALFAFLAALLAIAALMRWVATAGFGIFALYRIVLGGILLYMLYGAGGGCLGTVAL